MDYRAFGMALAMSASFSVGSAGAADFNSFTVETKAIADTLKCPNPKVTKTAGMPDLWGCILPGAEVMKVFVNASAGGRVENVKIMWNDWTKDVGYGVHTDKAIAEAWVTALATRYAPLKIQEVLDAFRGKSDAVISGDGVSLEYTYFRGPAIDERLITVIAQQPN